MNNISVFVILNLFYLTAFLYFKYVLFKHISSTKIAKKLFRKIQKILFKKFLKENMLLAAFIIYLNYYYYYFLSE